MKLDETEIKDLVAETERKRSNWSIWADEWERLWRLCDFNDDPKDTKDLDGIRSVVMPDPFNIIQLLQRMVADDMRVEIPSLSVKEDDEDRSELLEEWLVACDFESNRMRGRNHVNDMVWQSGVLGRGAARVIYTGGILPDGMDWKLPIAREILDPRNVGIARTYYGTEWGYHKYKQTRSYIERYYPKFKLEDKDKFTPRNYWNDKYTVIDFWAWHKGKVWHTVTIDDKFAMSPKATDYPDVPIVEWYADGAPVDDEMGRSLSILHPIRDVYQTKNDFISTMVTGMEYHYNPMIVTTNMGEQRLQFGPGSRVDKREDQQLEAFRVEPNVPMAQNMLSLLQTGIDQATFATSTYGDGPGGVTAGFAINNLAQASRARANVIRGNIEAALEAQNQILLGIVDRVASDEGIEIFGRSSRGDRGKPLRLTAKNVKGNYANRVNCTPEQTTDDNQKIMTWMSMVDKGIVSKMLMRNRVINVAMPRDEETRVAAEQALMMPEIQQKTTLRALQKTRKQEDWELLIVGTPLQALHEQEMQWREQKGHEAELAKQQRAEEKRQKQLQEQMAQMPPPMPPGMMPGGMPPEGPPGIPPPGMMPPGMPPMGPPSGGGPLPPMGPPPMQGPPVGPPTGPDMQPPGLTGIPPGMAGQFNPDALGIPPGAPGMFDQLMTGQGPTDEELLRSTGALQ